MSWNCPSPGIHWNAPSRTGWVFWAIAGMPWAVAAVIALVYGKTMTSFLLALGAILCGCSIVFMLDPGMRLGAGFFVWQGSFAILAVGSLAEMFVTKRLPAE